MAAPADNSFALRQLVDELGAQLRAGVEKLGDLPQETGERLARELGLVTREEYDALALRARSARAPAEAARASLARLGGASV